MGHLLLGVKNCISRDMNRMLTAIYSRKELFTALNGIGPTKDLGIDGFPTLFY